MGISSDVSGYQELGMFQQKDQCYSWEFHWKFHITVVIVDVSILDIGNKVINIIVDCQIS